MGTLLLLIIIVAIVVVIAKGGSSGTSARRAPAYSRARSNASAPRGAAGSYRSTSAWQPLSEADAVRESEKHWVAPGQLIEIAGRAIRGGMLYVGGGMRALHGYAADPALIDSGQRVARHGADRAGSSMPYWPSYSEISPAARTAYLDWLARGRRDPAAGIGYVFLFFYGIERRVLLDAKYSAAARAESPMLLEEVRELLRVHGGNSSFQRYASSFLDVVEASGALPDVSALDPPREKTGWEIPFEVKLAIGTFVAEGRPIPAEWALSWLLTHPEVYLRTPAQRCPEEFRQLFLLRYRERHGEGLVLRRNKTNLSIVYRPASPSFRGPVRVDLDVPDVTRLSAPVKRLVKLADGVQSELDRYSRWVGRNDDRDSPAALALLPAELVRDRMGPESERLVSWVDQALAAAGIAVVPAADLVRLWPAKEPGKLSKLEAAALADLLGHLGTSIEPDVRFGGTNLSRTDRAVVFRGPVAEAHPGDAYAGASALLHLGAAVAAADDEVTEDEERHLEEHLEQSLRLGAAERLRLQAHLRWLLASPPNPRSLKKKLEGLSEGDRHRIGRFLLALAGADGHVSPGELKVLSKIYPLLGLDPDALYGDVHDMTASTDRGPVTVLPADRAATDYAIPKPPVAPADKAAAVELDLKRVAAIRAETVEVAKVLGEIFADGEAEPVSIDEDDEDPPVSEETGTTGLHLPGLDPVHSALVRVLAEKCQWSHADFCALAESHGLMPAGAVEIINEASYAACDEPMLDGDDPLDVNPYALEEMLA